MKKEILGLLFSSMMVSVSPAQELIKTIDNAHTGQALSLSISKDAKTLLTSGSDNRVCLWDVKSGEKIKTFGGHTAAVNAVTYSSNDKSFITASADNKLFMWDSKTGKPKLILREHTAEVLCVAFNPINDNIASGSKDNSIKLWDGEKNTSITTLRGHTKQVNAVAFSADGKYLVSSSSDNTIKIWNASNGELKNTLNADSKGVIAVAYSADGKYIVSGGANSKVILWDVQTGDKIAEFNDSKGQINSIIFSPDVQYIAASGNDNKIFIWNIETRQIKIGFPAHDKTISAIAFSEKGNILVSVGNDNKIKIWDVSNLNIGKKKFAKETAEPRLVCTPLMLKEDNNNGILEVGEKSKITFTVKNQGKGKAYNMIAKVALENSVKGLSFEKEVLIGNLDADKETEASIPLTATPELASTSGTFIISIVEGNGYNPSPLKLNFQTKGASNYSFVMITDYEYSSGTGKAEIGAPITLKLKLKNTSQGEAKNVKIDFLLPEKVMAVNKLSEQIPSIQPDEIKEISMEFYATKEYKDSDLKIKLNIEGTAFSNVKDVNLAIKMNETLPTYAGATMAQNTAPTDTAQGQTLYRGSGDPLKGLNISKAKDMQIGDYYALIIGIDKYKGTWTPLVNAVRDAQAVESMLKTKYKFDYFHKLYDQSASRESIIKEFEWLVANVKERDNVFIYYSGHGEYKQALNKGYWVPADAMSTSTSNFISNSELQIFLAGIKSKHTLLVSDACFSGDIFRGSTVSIPFENSEKYYKEVHNLVSRQAITSGGIEPVMDGGKEGHSVFAYYLLKTLGNNNGKYLDASQLYNNVKIPVINNSEQSPKLNPIKNTGDEGGQFIFIKK